MIWGYHYFWKHPYVPKNTFPISQQNVFVMGLFVANKKLPCFPGESQNAWLNLSEWQWQIVERFFLKRCEVFISFHPKMIPKV